MKYLQLNKDDSIFVITSAGDNALHYAIQAQPKRVSRLVRLITFRPSEIPHPDSLRRHESVVRTIIVDVAAIF